MKVSSLPPYFLRTTVFLVGLLQLTTVYAADPDCVAKKTCVPLSINNQSGYPLFIEIAGSQKKSWFNFSTGEYDYNKAFSSDNLKEVDQGTYSFNLPGDGIIGGGRMYFSSKEKMNGVPDLATAPIIFDKIEMGWDNTHTAVWNTTSVDYFAIPLNMSQQNQNGVVSTVGFKEGTTREGVLNELKNEMQTEPKLFDAKFFMTAPASAPNAGELLRIFSPLHFYTTLPDMWHDSIADGLSKLDAGGFTQFTYNGQVYTNFHRLSDTSVSILENGKSAIISGITTSNASSGQIQPVGDGFAGMLSAAINRGVLSTPEHWGQNGGQNAGYPQYYYQGAPGKYLYNTYAAALLKFAIDSKLYATSYDDYWHMDSSLNVGAGNNNSVTIKILPFN